MTPSSSPHAIVHAIDIEINKQLIEIDISVRHRAGCIYQQEDWRANRNGFRLSSKGCRPS